MSRWEKVTFWKCSDDHHAWTKIKHKSLSQGWEIYNLESTLRSYNHVSRNKYVHCVRKGDIGPQIFPGSEALTLKQKACITGGGWLREASWTQEFMVKPTRLAQNSDHKQSGKFSKTSVITKQQPQCQQKVQWINKLQLETAVCPLLPTPGLFRPSNQPLLWREMSLLASGFIFHQAKIIFIITTISSGGHTRLVYSEFPV